jgi:hypothetical protein
MGRVSGVWTALLALAACSSGGSGHGLLDPPSGPCQADERAAIQANGNPQSITHPAYAVDVYTWANGLVITFDWSVDGVTCSEN